MSAAHVDVVILLGVEPAPADRTDALDPLELLSVHLVQRLLVVDGRGVKVERRDAVEHLLAVGLLARKGGAAVSRVPLPGPGTSVSGLLAGNQVRVDRNQVGRKVLEKTR